MRALAYTAALSGLLGGLLCLTKQSGAIFIVMNVNLLWTEGMARWVEVRRDGQV